MAKNNKENYYKRVYEITMQIPVGRDTTYGTIAQYFGIASAARMVGYALNRSPADVPAHRVLNRNGYLNGRGYFPGETLRERLSQENMAFSYEYKFYYDQH